MPDANDMDLVREFARDHSEPAFAELVQRHINLVYSVALRCTSSPEDAQDVTQAVFIILSRKAASLRERTILTGWLYETTRFTAARLLRTKARHAAREREAYMLSTLNESDSAQIWQQLAPHLEDAMSRLAERDRTLLALRFFENKTGSEAAATLGIGEDAAHKRTARALEKLRGFFSKRGIALSATVIAGAVSAGSVQAAPVGMAATISTVALAKGAAAGGSTLALVKGALKLMAWTKAKTVVVVGVGVLLAAGTTTVTIMLFGGEAKGHVEFQHAKTYDTPLIHARSANASAPTFWENPIILFPVKVDYPAWARMKSPSGVLMRLHVDEGGSTRRVEVISREMDAVDTATGERLAQLSIEAVSKLKFEPLILESGAPQSYVTVVSLTYRPKEEE